MSFSKYNVPGNIRGGGGVMDKINSYNLTADFFMIIVSAILIITCLMGQRIYSDADKWKQNSTSGDTLKKQERTNDFFFYTQIVGLVCVAIFGGNFGYIIGSKNTNKTTFLQFRDANIVTDVFAFITPAFVWTVCSLGISMFNDVLSWKDDKSRRSAESIKTAFVWFIVISAIFWAVYVGNIGYTSVEGKKLFQAQTKMKVNESGGGGGGGVQGGLSQISEFFTY